jgi:glycosyltransferase involved in cell wall biosynthesis
MWEVYEGIDVAVMATTVCEPFGRVPLEAAAAGAPTIAPAVGGIPESIRHEEDGLLYRFLDVEDLERQMRRVLEERDLVLRLIRNVRRPPDTADVAATLEAYYIDAAARASCVSEKIGVAPTPRSE